MSYIEEANLVEERFFMFTEICDMMILVPTIS
jgi:hypothetical protein